MFIYQIPRTPMPLNLVHNQFIKAFDKVTKDQEGFWMCRGSNGNGDSASCLHLIVAECNINRKIRKSFHLSFVLID